jgi:glutaminyl-tRNA synthetase
MRLGK